MPGWRRMPDAVLVGLLDRLGIAASAGIDLRRAWDSEAGRLPARWRPAMRQVAEHLRSGTDLAAAMASAAGVFPAVVLGMVRVGDRTGRLAETLRETSQTVARTVASRRQLRAAVAGPAVRVAVAVAAIGVLIVVSGTARGLDGKPLDMVGLGLTGVDGLVRFLGAVAAVVAGTAVVWPIVARSWRDHGWARAVGKRIPWLGSAARSAEGAAWSRAASLAAHTGLSPGELVDLASAAAPGLSIERTLLEGRLRQGHDLAEALGEVGRLPREILEAIAVGEMTGNTAETLDRVAGRLEEAAIRGSAAAVRAVGFVAWALVAALVAMLVIRVASVYVGMIQEAARPL